MPIITHCTTCQSKFHLPDNLAGQQIQCQSCQAVFVAPQVNTAPAPVAPVAPAPAAAPIQPTAAPTQPPAASSSGGSFMSVFDEVSDPSAPTTSNYGGGYAQQSPYSDSGYDDGMGSGLPGPNKGVLIGILSVAGLLVITLCAVAWFQWGEDDDSGTVANSSSATEQSSDNKSNNPFLSSSKVPGKDAEDVERRKKELSLQAKEVEKQRLKKEKIEAELAEFRKKEVEERKKRDAERAAERSAAREKRDAERKIEYANGKADREGRKRDGESFEDWVARSFQVSSSYTVGRFLTVLDKEEVQPEHLELVSDLLCDYVRRNDDDNFDQVAPLMSKWRTEKTDQLILECVTTLRVSGSDKTALMKALTVVGTAEAAEKLALALDGDHHEATRYLTQMGPIAEPAVLPYLNHESSFVRAAVYQVLGEVGTRQSLGALSKNFHKEKLDSRKAKCEAAMDAIRTRHPVNER